MLERERKWLKGATAEYRARKKAAEAQVDRWEWCTKTTRVLEPLFLERMDIPRGKVLQTKPKAPAIGNVAYGLDGAERVVVEREYLLRGAFKEQFFAWHDAHVEAVGYDDRKQATIVRRG